MTGFQVDQHLAPAEGDGQATLTDEDIETRPLDGAPQASVDDESDPGVGDTVDDASDDAGDDGSTGDDADDSADDSDDAADAGDDSDA